MITNRSRGFTLIELLVVIAIIGILSAVVLASLSTARSKGNDAAVQSNLSTIQTEAEIYYGGAGGNSYGTPTGSCVGGMFSADTTIANAIKSAAGAAKAGVAMVCNSGGGSLTAAAAYAVSAPLSTPTTQSYFCVDSSGNATTTQSLITSQTVCPYINSSGTLVL